MNQRIIYIVGGLIVILSGYITFKEEWWYLHGFKVPRSLGVIFICFGAVLLVVGIFNKNMLTSDIIMKCPTCLKVFRETETKDNICPNCGNELEPLRGYFERHPKVK